MSPKQRTRVDRLEKAISPNARKFVIFALSADELPEKIERLQREQRLTDRDELIAVSWLPVQQ